MLDNERYEAGLPQTIEQLQSALRGGVLTCRQYVENVIRRIETVNPGLNAIVIMAFDKALKQADEVDRKIRTGEPLGALFGVPVTVKECIDLEGTPTTWGLPGKRNDIPATHDPLVAKLLEADAIIIGKTNVQQLLLGPECVNPLYGRSVNPHHAERTPGGSSGGEGAAVAARMSMFGLGTDAGGSVRIPAHFCGIHGFKPTSGTLRMNPPREIYTMKREVAQRIAQPGVLARNVADLTASYNVLADTRLKLEPDAVKRLRVGYFTDDGIIEPSSSIKRLVEEAVSTLRRQGSKRRKSKSRIWSKSAVPTFNLSCMGRRKATQRQSGTTK